MCAQNSSYFRKRCADYAARLMLENRSLDFARAKKKAEKIIHHQGLYPQNRGNGGHGDAMPSNDEVELAIRERLAIFNNESMSKAQLLSQHAMLVQIIEVMKLLAPYSPYLTGAHWAGYALPNTPVELLVFVESSKEFEINLINHNISFQFLPLQDMPPKAETSLKSQWPQCQNLVIIHVFSKEQERLSLFKKETHHHKNEGGGGRGRLSQVQALCDAWAHHDTEEKLD